MCFCGDDWHHLWSLKWQQSLVCGCSTAATSGKDAARVPPPPPHMTSPGSPSQLSGRSLREKNKPEPPEPAGFLRAPVRLFARCSFISQPGVPSGEMRWLQSLQRGLYTLASRPAGQTGIAASRCRFCGTLSANKVRCDPKDRRSSIGSRRTRLVFLALGQDSHFSRFSVADASWGVPTHPPRIQMAVLGRKNKGRHGIQQQHTA